MHKVAIIAPNSLPIPPIRGGGVQTVVAETTPFFKNFKPYIFSNCEYGIDHLPLMETVGNIEHRRICQSPWEEFKVRFTNLSTLNYLPYVLEIIDQIKEIKPEIIHVLNRPWFLPILRKHLGPDQKIILHHFNNYLMEMKKENAKKYLDLIDGFIGCSQFTVNAEVATRFPELKNYTSVISNGVDIDKFDPKKIRPEIISSTKAKYGIKNGDVVVLYVGRLSEDKGALQVLQAVKTLVVNLAIPEVKLLVVGSSFYGGAAKMTPFIKKLHKEAEDIKNNIIFTGYIDRKDIQDIFAVGDIVAVPSIVQDASPTVCYEASSMKKPIVASRRGGIPEIVTDGETGLIYDDPYDVDALVDKLLFFIKNPENRGIYGEKGRLMMEKSFTWKIVAEKIEKAYNRVLNIGGKNG
jgi:spore coat protein SA